MGYAQYRWPCGIPIHEEIRSGRNNVRVAKRNIGTSQILFFVKNHPWVAEANAKLPMQAIMKIRIP